jgi:predicted nucleic acid-binding protein
VKQWVIDTSVVAAAFFAESGKKAATKLFASGDELLAPDLIHAEFANVVWKRCRSGDVDEEPAAKMLADFRSLPLSVTASEPLLLPALQLAIRTDRTVYDCLFLALAVQSDCQMVTNDLRLVNSLKNTPLAEYIKALDT